MTAASCSPRTPPSARSPVSTDRATPSGRTTIRPVTCGTTTTSVTPPVKAVCTRSTPPRCGPTTSAGCPLLPGHPDPRPGPVVSVTAGPGGTTLIRTRADYIMKRRTLLLVLVPSALAACGDNGDV